MLNALRPSRRLPDEQYIEQIRKGLRMHAKMRYVHAVIGLLFLGVCVYGLTVFVRVLSISSTNQQGMVYTTFVLAIMLGMMLGFWILQAVLAMVMALYEPRKEQLLIDCWDELTAMRDISERQAVEP